MTTAPPQTTTKRRRADAHPPYNWQLRAQTLEKQAANDANTIAELRRQVADLTLQVIQPAPVSLSIEGQPLIHIPDYLRATLTNEYNSGRETFPTSPRYQSFDGYVVERIKDAVYGLNGLNVREKGQ